MTHPDAWTCRACGVVLGQVRDGVLRPIVRVELIDRLGVARLPCPRCEEVRHWFPAGTAAAVAGTRRPSDQPD